MNTCPAKRQREAGVSLVELMVGMVVGLILLGGILQILLGNRESFDVQRQQAELQQNARLASYLLSTALPHAGYRADAFDSEADVFGANAVISGTEGGKAGNPDSVRVRLQARGGIHDCRGSEIVDAGPDGTNGTADDVPEIADFEFRIDAAANELECRVYNPDGTVNTTEPLLNNVENMQIEYGVDSDNDGSVDRYQEANAANFARVRSLRIQLLMATRGNVRTEDSVQTFRLLDGNINTNDRRQREIVEQVIALRNRLP